MDIFDKLRILTDAAKYDVACTSSGVDRNGRRGTLGSAVSSGICHSFSADGRCISLLKVVMSNACSYDCKYCVNRCSNDVERATFTPRELAELTIQFYRRNYIEGLFLSSAIVRTPDNTSELLYKTVKLLREDYGFRGYVHVKAIPGTSPEIMQKLGLIADRMSVNIELPSENSLKLLAPQKTRESILKPMGLLTDKIAESRHDIVLYRHAPKFVPAGQATQMIIGATPETDLQILNLTQALYRKYSLKRVFFSAYVPVVSDRNLPALDVRPPLLREHRLYQADWLLRFYGFTADEILDEKNPNFNPYIDPKCNWALNHLEYFPVEVNRADRELLLRVPGIGVKSADRIIQARRHAAVDFEGLKRLGVVLKRARFFITCGGRTDGRQSLRQDTILRGLLSDDAAMRLNLSGYTQTSMFDTSSAEELQKCLTGQI